MPASAKTAGTSFGFDAEGNYIDVGVELATRELVMRKGGASPTASQAAYLAADPTPSPAGRVPTVTWLKGPKTNVFDDWVAVSWEAGNYTPDCVAWFKRNHPGLNIPTGFTARERPNMPAIAPRPTLPASPGW